MVDRLPALLPLPAGHRRGGQAARRQPDNLARWPAAWVARRPAAVSASGPPPGSHESATATGQPPRGGSPATAMSPPRLTRTPPCPAGPACRRGRAVRSESLGRRAEIQDDPGGQPQRGAIQRHRSPARHRTGRRQAAVACRHRWPRNRGHIQRDERGADRRIGHATSPSRGGERDADRLGQTAAQLMNGAGRGGSGTVPNRRGTGWPAGPAGPARHRPRPAPRPGHREARPPRVRWCPERPARRPRRRRRRGHRSSLPGRPCRISGPARGWPHAGCPRRGGPGRASGILPFPGMAHVDHDRALVPAPGPPAPHDRTVVRLATAEPPEVATGTEMHG